MLVSRFRGYYSIIHREELRESRILHLSDGEEYFHDLYEKSVQIGVLFENLSSVHDRSHFNLVFRESVLDQDFRIRLLRQIPDEYQDLLLISSFDCGHAEHGLLRGCNLSSDEWSMLSDIRLIQTALEDLVEGRLTVSDIVKKILPLRIAPLILYRIARAHFLLNQQADLLIDRIYPLTDLIELYLTEGVITTKRMLKKKRTHLLWLDSVNFPRLMVDIDSPFSEIKEYPDSVYHQITGLNKKGLRRSILWSLLSLQEATHLPLDDFSPIDAEIILWYNRAEENKLSRSSLEMLLKILADHPRAGWNEELIIMRMRRTVCPDQNFTKFCRDYDKEMYDRRSKQMNQVIRAFLDSVQVLGPTFKVELWTSWEDLFNIMERDKSFLIPLLSPRGLLMLYSRSQMQISPFLTELLEFALHSAFPGGQIDGIFNQRDD